jgi:7-cyano-7-deazaguanine synthase
VADRPIVVVLVSGGLDSCVAAAQAAVDHRPAFLHLSYRQRTEARELRAFTALADHFEAEPRLVLEATFIERIGGTSLVGSGLPVPEDEPVPGEIPTTYVPFRNANLLGIAVAWAETLDATAVYIGAHQADSAYPDCRASFFAAYNLMVAAGIRSDRKVEIRTPLIDLDKAEIVRRGAALHAPLHLTWSCYQSQELACGRCHSCRLRLAGFRAAGLEDPIPYAR